jgi:hypothetical protein
MTTAAAEALTIAVEAHVNHDNNGAAGAVPRSIARSRARARCQARWQELNALLLQRMQQAHKP